MWREFFSKVGDYVHELKAKNEQLQFENEVLKRDREALLQRVYALSAECEIKATVEQLSQNMDKIKSGQKP